MACWWCAGRPASARPPCCSTLRETAAAAGFRVEDAAGVEAEAEFAFAGLHQLCAPMLARAAELPEPQQAALGVAFGMREGAAPDRFLVGLAVLSLLAEVAEDGPLLCVVDDAQWLDQASAQVLAFVARRVAAERVVMVFALRDPGVTDVDAFAGLPELRLAGLGESDARTMLATAVRAPLDDVVRDRIVAEARGNPLALLELPRGAPEVQLAGGFELPDVVSVAAPRRGRFPAPLGQPAARYAAAAAGRRGRADRRCGAAVARGRGAGDRPRGGRARGGRRAAGDRHPGAVPTPAGALGGLPGGHAARPAPRARRAGRRHRPAGRPRPARLAPRAGGAGHRRGGRRGAGAFGRTRPRPRRTGRRGGVPRSAQPS